MDAFEEFGEAVKRGTWPSREPQELFDVADFYEQRAAVRYQKAWELGVAYQRWSSEVLDSSAGDAQQAATEEQAAAVARAAEQDREAARVAREVGYEHLGTRRRIELAIEDAHPRHQEALRQRQAAEAAAILARCRGEAVDMAAGSAARVTAMLSNNPFAEAPPPDPEKGGKDEDTSGRWSEDDPTAGDDKDSGMGDAEETSGRWSENDQTVVPPRPADGPSGAEETSGRWSETDPTTVPPAAVAGPAVSPAAGGGGSPSVGSSGGSSGTGISGLGGASALGAGGGSKAPGVSSPGVTGPASAGAAGSPVGRLPGENLMQPFVNGVGPGTAAGAAAAGPNPQQGFFGPAQSPVQQPLGPFPTSPVEAGPAQSPGVVSGGPANPAGPAAGPGPGGVQSVNTVPPMAGTPVAGPMMPYAPPGGAAGGVVPPVAGASPGPSPAPAGSGPVGGPVPVVSTRGSGSSAGPEPPNPHLLRARQVLDGLIRGTRDVERADVSAWAVGVVEHGSTQQVVVASSGGNADYLPATVFLPWDVALAVRAGPHGWAGSRFVGWRKPVVVIEEFYQALRDGGYWSPRLLAVATNEYQARRPQGCGAFDVVLDDVQVLRHPVPAPPLDAHHRHRLAVIDEALLGRLDSLGKQHGYPAVGAAITAAVLGAAEAYEPSAELTALPEDHGFGWRLTTPADRELWDRIKAAGAVSEEAWTEWLSERDRVFYPPSVFAPQDLGDDVNSRDARLRYWHGYRAARLGELLRCWNPAWPEHSVYNVAYCAITGGFSDDMARALAS